MIVVFFVLVAVLFLLVTLFFVVVAILVLTDFIAVIGVLLVALSVLVRLFVVLVFFPFLHHCALADRHIVGVANQRWQQTEQAAPTLAPRLFGRLTLLAGKIHILGFHSRGPSRARLPDGLHVSQALILEDALHPADRIALAVEQMPDASQEVDVVRAIIATAAAALHRLDFTETAFPEPQHMLRHIQIGGHFADGAECVRRLLHRALLLCDAWIPWPSLAKPCLALLGPAWPLLPGLGFLVVALGPFFEIKQLRAVGINPLLEYRGRLEHHHPARRYRHFLAGLGIPANPLTLLANHEGAEGRQLHGLASFKAIRDLLQHQLD